MEYIPFKDENIKRIIKMESNLLKMAYEGLQKEMPLELFSEALQFVNEEMSLPINPKELEIILSSNGYAYANIIEFGVGNDTEADSSIRNAVASHYMHRPYPMYLEKDFIDIKEFESRLLEEVIKRNNKVQ